MFAQNDAAVMNRISWKRPMSKIVRVGLRGFEQREDFRAAHVVIQAETIQWRALSLGSADL
jgi:hypothetical protein